MSGWGILKRGVLKSVWFLHWRPPCVHNFGTDPSLEIIENEVFDIHLIYIIFLTNESDID